MPQSKRLLVQNFMPMIQKKAWEAWRHLPQHTRSWFDIEDMISDGVIFTRYHVIPRYKNMPRRKSASTTSSFSTFLYLALENHYRRVTNVHRAQKRFDGFTVSIDAGAIKSPTVDASFVDQLQDSDLFCRIYSEATPELRVYLSRWFLSKERTKFRTKDKRFRAAKKEFLGLCNKYGFGPDEFRRLQQ